MTQTLGTGEIAEGSRISALSRKVVALMLLVTLVDSYDQSALAYAAPAIVRDWGIETSAMGPVFGAQMAGMMLGGILFGYLGDRLGRRSVVIGGTLLFGLLSLATMLVQSLPALLLIRFIVGVGVGGVTPNAVALANEYAPRRFQVTAVALMFIGYVFGGVGGGAVSAWLLPRFGWEIVFLIGGVVPLVMAAILVWQLPESIKFLVLDGRPDRRAQALALVARMRPDLNVQAGTRLVDDSPAAAGRGLALLFDGALRSMTPMLWIAYIANSITAFGIISWMPILLETMGFPGHAAAIATALMFAAAALGGLLMGLIVDRRGIGPLIATPAAAIPAMIAIGFLKPGAEMLLFALAALVGFFAFGFQNSLHGIGGSIYPTQVRALGVGWALSVSKAGGIVGPAAGGMLLAAGASPLAILTAAAVPLLGSSAAIAVLRGRYHAGRAPAGTPVGLPWGQ
jgi:AAHS family 4-hydroxybenzoate transporter-like MFS transporter